MTTKELAEQLQQERAEFYSWVPGPDMDLEARFRCHHIPSRPVMRMLLCRGRAVKPDIFRIDCSGCPRWKYWRKQAKRAAAPKSRKRAYT